jgi:hypothetical protein
MSNRRCFAFSSVLLGAGLFSGMAMGQDTAPTTIVVPGQTGAVTEMPIPAFGEAGAEPTVPINPTASEAAAASGAVRTGEMEERAAAAGEPGPATTSLAAPAPAQGTASIDALAAQADQAAAGAAATPPFLTVPPPGPLVVPALLPGRPTLVFVAVPSTEPPDPLLIQKGRVYTKHDIVVSDFDLSDVDNYQVTWSIFDAEDKIDYHPTGD